MNRNKLFILIVSLFIIIFMITSCSNNDTSPSLERISFVLDWTPNTNHTGVYAAIANGYYEAEGLEVDILFPPEMGAAGLVASGRAQFGVSFQEYHGIELTLDHPLPITAVAAIISHNNSGIISLKEKGVDDFSKIDGMVYASWEAPGEVEILMQTILDAGGNYDSLVRFPAPAADPISMIQSGLVDLVWVYESWDVIAAQLAGVEYNFIRFADASPVLDFYTPIIIANDDFLERNTETAKKFIQATAKGYQFAIEYPAQAARILLDAVPELPADLIFSSQEFLAGSYAGPNQPWGVFDTVRWGAFYDWMYEQGLIPAPLGSHGFTNNFVLP